MVITVVRPGETIPARVSTLDPALPQGDSLFAISASLSSPIFSYNFDADVNDPALIIAEHHLSYPERLKVVKVGIEKHERDIQFLYNQNQQLHHQNQQLYHQIQELQHERQENLTTQLHWKIRSRIAQALNDTYVQELLQQDEYVHLKSNGHNYLPVVLSSWAVFTDREPATHLISMGEIDDEAMGMHVAKGVALRRNDLEASIEFVWGSIPDLERNVMISMFLTRPPNRKWIAHPDPTIDQSRHFIHLDPRIPQAEKAFIRDFIPIAEDKSKKRLFSSG